MPPTVPARSGSTARAAWLVLLSLLIAVLLYAFWMVCADQVRKAEARRSNQIVEQRAVEECVRQNSHGSLINCADRAADQRAAAQPPVRSMGVPAPAR